MFVQINLRYCKITTSNKQLCGSAKRASIAKLLTRYNIEYDI